MPAADVSQVAFGAKARVMPSGALDAVVDALTPGMGAAERPSARLQRRDSVVGAPAPDGLVLADTRSLEAFLALPEPLAVPSLHLTCKRGIDIVVSATLLLLLSPVLALAALAVKLGGGPVFFSQSRVGLSGRTFECFKFRSMVPDAEARLEALLQTDPVRRSEWTWGQKLRHDPRITRVGHILRKTSIDELPQLWNVLRGDMSLVGPRPIMVSQLSRYGMLARWYTAMRPGITGLWQVTARGDADFERRVRLDCDYVRNYRFVLDFAILLKTVAVVLSGRGAM